MCLCWPRRWRLQTLLGVFPMALPSVKVLLTVLQVLYLVLVQLLGNLRGNQLEPPPPEAFEQGFLHLFRGLS